MKRLNPNTGLPFKHGDIREDGYIFVSYVASRIIKSTGYFKETWLSVEKFSKYRQRQKLYAKSDTNLKRQRVKNKERHKTLSSSKTGKISLALNRLKSRAKRKNIDCDLDYDYLFSIATDICPILNIKLFWNDSNGKILPSTPSVDRIDPTKGYLKNNVQWISYLANAMKQNASPKELHKFADWVKSTIRLS